MNIPDHGELWGIPTSATPTKDGITTIWSGLRFGYRLTRNITLDGPSILAEYTLNNLAPFQLNFVWAMHALLSMNSPVEVSLPEIPYQLNHDGKGREIQKPFSLSEAGELRNLARPDTLPPNQAWKIFSSEPISGPVIITYPRREGRTLTLEYASEDQLKAYWGIWINTGAWEGHHHFAIEPTTGRFDQLDRSVRDGSAGCIGPGGKASWSVRWGLT